MTAYDSNNPFAKILRVDRHQKPPAYNRRVPYKVFAHDGEADQANITLIRAHYG